MKRTESSPTSHTPSRRLRAAGVALALLCIAFPAIATALGAIAMGLLGFAATHATLVLATAGVLFLLRATGTTGHRALKAFAGVTAARVLIPA